ncbi:MAG: hypothetical protein BME93_05580 [Methanosarcinales archaeon Met12]|nr:MAG: hypothetical protein BME93_05580 [Methanosarcinales archaeon Met12]
MKNKTLVLMVAVVCIGLFVLPEALALFTGMHRYVAANRTDCTKCHPAEAAELSASPYHWRGGPGGVPRWGATVNDACLRCHQVAGEFNRTIQHSAVTIRCAICHAHVSVELMNATEAHRRFYINATAAGIQRAGNEACIACHTMVGFNYTPRPPINLTYSAITGAFGTIPR